MRDRVALLLIVIARRMTTWGFVMDHLDEASRTLRGYIRNPPV